MYRRQRGKHDAYMSHLRHAIFARLLVPAGFRSLCSSFRSSELIRLTSTRRQTSLRTNYIRSFANMPPIERVTDKLETPALDDRSYRVIRLPNKLEALLVHDADTDKSSAAVNVNVGSFSDADDMPGMAHAVEHMLFMGTKKVYTLRIRSYLLLTHCSIPRKMPTINT